MQLTYLLTYLNRAIHDEATGDIAAEKYRLVKFNREIITYR